MSIALSVFGVWALALGLLLVAGYGIGRWLTPPQLQPYELLLTPLWGYGWLVFVAYYGLNTFLTLRSALIVAVGGAALLGIWRIARPGASGRFPRMPVGDGLIIGVIGLISGVLGVIPLFRAGYLLPIGHGWDIEFYLPLAAYLQDYSYRSLASAPSAPLRDVILAAPTSVRAIGFSYVQGMVDLLGRWSPIGTFPLLLALIKALAVAPVYLLLRVGFGADRRGAAFGALLVAVNELWLWISYNNFAMHVSSMPLVPLATLLTLLALRDETTRRRSSGSAAQQWIVLSEMWPMTHDRAIMGAIAATTMLTLSYHPALLAYGALAAGLGAWALIANPDKRCTLLRGAAIIAGCLLFGFLAHWRAPRAFFDVYSARTPSIGGERFARLTELFGVETFHHLPPAIEQPAWMNLAGWIALGLLALGIGAALWRHFVQRGPALALLLFALLYGLGLRYVIAFPYGFYKGVSYLSFLPLGIAGVGLAGARSIDGVRLRWPAYMLRVPAALLVLAMTGWSTYRLLETYRAPVLASGSIAALASAVRDLPPGTVELVDHPELRGPPLGLVAVGLYGHAWIGRGQTGFAVFNRQSPGTQPQYALMHTSEDPRAWGFAPEDVIARGGPMVLYRAPRGATAFLSGNAASYARASGSLRQRLDSLQVQDLTHGDYETVQPAAPRVLYVATDPSGDRLSWQPIGASAGQARTLVLDVSTATAQTLTVDAGQPQTFDLPVGVSRVVTNPFAGSGTIELQASAAPIVIRSAQLYLPDAPATGLRPLSDTLAIATSSVAQSSSIATTIAVTSSAPDVVRVGLELYEISERAPRRYGGGVFAVRANEPATLTLDLQAPAATLNGGAVALTPDSVQDGEYFGALWLYQGANLVRRVPFVRFERRDNQVINVQPLDANATFARNSITLQPVDAAIGPVRVAGYSLSSEIRAGATAQLDVQWQATDAVPGEPLLVFAQVLAPDDRKWAAWDGAAGGDWWPSPAWRAGDRIRQSIPLMLDPQTPPGRYRLAVGLYRLGTGERLPVIGANAQNGLIVLGEIAVDR